MYRSPVTQKPNVHVHTLSSLKRLIGVVGNFRAVVESKPRYIDASKCIVCSRCVRACDEVQGNDVLGRTGKGHAAGIAFDLDRPMGESTCVACGECVQACPTGALMEANLLDEAGTRRQFPDRHVDTLCPYCGVGCQTRVHVKEDRILYVDGRNGPANEQRLCVKGRFGFDYITHPQRLTKPMIRRDDAPAKGLNVDPANPWTHFREATWDDLKSAMKKLIKYTASGGYKSCTPCKKKGKSNEKQHQIFSCCRNNGSDHI